MLYEVQTGRSVTGATMRRWSGARTSGTNLMDLQRAFRRLGQPLQIREDMRWSTFLHEVRRGRSAVVQGWYGNLRRNVLQAGFTTAHSVFVLGYSPHARHRKGGFYVMDPLGTGGYDGAWWSRAELRRFGWSGRPGTVGTGRNAYHGNVALQAHPSGRGLSLGKRPAFRSYWDTSKDLMQRSRKVNIVPRHPDRIFPLRVEHPRLRLRAQQARRADLERPVRFWKRTVQAMGVTKRRLLVRTGPRARVVAAASGMVVYRGWSTDGSRTLWIQHGPRLFTIYKNLATVRVEPGRWVRAGATLGRVDVTTVRRKGARQPVKRGTLVFMVTTGDPGRVSTRHHPLPFLPDDAVAP
jgi:hypothetical protein